MKEQYHLDNPEIQGDNWPMNQRPIPVKEVEKYLPHRPPMVWIDKVVSFSEKAGECVLQLKSDALYWGPMGLRPTSCLEFIAQAYGFISVCHHIYILDPNSKPLSKAFLASINKTNLPQAEALAQFKTGDVLRVVIDGVRQMGPIVMFRGQVLHQDRLVCSAHMKVFKEYQK
jgi:predicted hotdog family 3-hydroxylacyl-ACP dehydratase